MASPLPLPLLGFGGFPKLIEPRPIPLYKVQLWAFSYPKGDRLLLPVLDLRGGCLSPIVSAWVALALGGTIAGHGAIESSHRGLVLRESSHN